MSDSNITVVLITECFDAYEKQLKRIAESSMTQRQALDELSDVHLALLGMVDKHETIMRECGHTDDKIYTNRILTESSLEEVTAQVGKLFNARIKKKK